MDVSFVFLRLIYLFLFITFYGFDEFYDVDLGDGLNWARKGQRRQLSKY